MCWWMRRILTPRRCRCMQHTPPRQQRFPLLALRRPPWQCTVGDRWTEVEDVEGAVQALGDTSRRIFVALGASSLPHSRRRLSIITSYAASIPSKVRLRFAMRFTSTSAGRSSSIGRAGIAGTARNRCRRGEEQRRRCCLRQDCSRTGARAARDHAAPAGIAERGGSGPHRRGSAGLARSRAHRLDSTRRIDQGRASGARDHAGIGRADDNQRRHVCLRGARHQRAS